MATVEHLLKRATELYDRIEEAFGNLSKRLAVFESCIKSGKFHGTFQEVGADAFQTLTVGETECSQQRELSIVGRSATALRFGLVSWMLVNFIVPHCATSTRPAQ